MRVTYYLRDKREGNYSIEQIFGAIGSEISNQYDINFFYVDSTKNKLQNVLRARKVQGDINHITGDVNWLALGLNRKKTLLTIHDLGHFERTLKGLSKWLYRLVWLELPLRRVAFVTTISGFTKDRVVTHFPFIKNKIKVIYNPLPKFFINKKKIFNSTCPRILQVGSMPNKNLEGLLNAIDGIDCTIVLVRKPDKETISKLKSAGIKYEFQFNLDDKKIVEVYESCDMLFFASTYEGFGMPIIEGQAIGLPVITSNICSMPEVAGSGAHIVDPNDVQGIRQGILEIIENKDHRDCIIKEGLSNVKRFQLGDVTEQYLDLYKTIISIG